MQALNRAGVEFDMCPSCRGVWLDRGELEKVIENVRAESVSAPPVERHTQPRPVPPSEPYYSERGEHRERGERGHDHRRRKRGFDMFDIFD
jgi:hypothetical protein